MQYLVSVIYDQQDLATPDEMEAIDAFNRQLQANGHRFAHAMRAYIEWLQPMLGAIARTAPGRVSCGGFGRGARTRTEGLRFWRPTL